MKTKTQLKAATICAIISSAILYSVHVYLDNAIAGDYLDLAVTWIGIAIVSIVLILGIISMLGEDQK